MSKSRFSDVLETFEMLMDNEHLLPHKNTADSIKARKDGNALYASKSHDKQIHEHTLCLYNRSILFAKENSEELALGYGNRSALLMHLRKYKECLIDIDRACGITKSEELKKKLATRRRECLIKIDEEKKEHATPPVYNFNPSKTIPYASELVTVKYNEKYGRHVVATQDIQPGTVVFVEKGFLLSPDMYRIDVNCSHCLNLAWNGIPCNCCSSAVYCSEKCKEEAWHEYHDIECSILPYIDYLANRFDSMAVELAFIRLFIKAVKTKGLREIAKMAEPVDKPKDCDFSDFFDNLTPCNKLKLIFNLSSIERNKPQNDALCSVVAFLIVKKTKTCDTLKNSNLNDSLNVLKVLKKLRNIVANNAFLFQSFGTTYEEVKKNMSGTSFGVILAPFSSFFNHSCVPNVDRLFTQNQEVLFYSTHFIKKEEQLFVNYGTNQLMDKIERLYYCQLEYQFVCNCPACTENWPSVILTKLDVDAQDSTRIYSDLVKNKLLSSFNLIHKCPNKWHSTDYSIMDAVKIMNVLHKYYSGFEAYKHTYFCTTFITFYFEKHYSSKVSIPADC